jgi:hypothetical protein
VRSPLDEKTTGSWWALIGQTCPNGKTGISGFLKYHQKMFNKRHVRSHDAFGILLAKNRIH